ncbi:MAG: Zn-dependent exopeptidase M28, partial [Treponema sp.]|nr:Zn-dependent exopeptidase M28 [Treponema sp.]
EDFHEYIKDLLTVIPDENFTLDEIIENYYMKLKYSSINEYYETVKDIIIQYDINSFDEFNKYIGEYYGINVNEEGILPLYNIIVKLDAPQTDRGVLFVAHYDSEHKTPGASDNMLAVVSLLEALRSQAQNNTLKTNLYFLFTDGEELGLLGSFIFIEEYPELKDKIDMVVNFDARGNSGPLLLFETSPNAYNLAEVYKKSGAWLYGFSVSTQLYHMMQDNIRPGTDFIVFLKENYNGLNFAIIEGVKAYHEYNLIDDSYENLNRNTAWHHLQVTLSLAGYTANNNSADLQKPSAEAVFFPFLPGRIALITAIVSHIICAFSCALALAVITFKIINRRIKPVLPFILMCLLITVSIICAVFFTSASYLFYIPLLLSAVTSLIKKWYALHLTVKMASYIIVLMLYVPLIISIWQAVIVPMML